MSGRLDGLVRSARSLLGPGPASRAQRTAAARLRSGGVWPHWLERQLDPASPAFVPLGDVPSLTNVTARSWTMVGNIGSSQLAIVDPTGLVTPWPDGWSLDWWVGAEDRWHLPSREAAVRQRLVGDAPVVETAMRVPGGDILHRAFAIRSAPGDGAEELVVVEIENATPVPVAIALAVRPYNPEGVATVERIGLLGRTQDERRGGAPRAVTVDGRVAMLLPKAPNRVAASTFAAGDVSDTVLRGEAGTIFPDGLRCEDGLASAALLYPLPHTATLSVLLPLAPAAPAGRRRAGRRASVPVPAATPVVPSAAQVANGWKAHAGRGMRLVLPDTRLSACVEASRRSLLLLHDGRDITSGPATDHRFGFRDAASLLGALDRFGYRDEVSEVVGSYPERQAGDGSFATASGGPGSTGAALHAIGEHWRLHRDHAALEGAAPVVAAAAEWIERTRGAGRGDGGRPERVGLLPAGPTSGGAGPAEADYADTFWSIRGLHDAAEVLDAVGELDAAAETRMWAKRFAVDLDASLALVAAHLGTDAIPAGPSRRVDHGTAESLAACWPLRLLAADDPRASATVEAVREQLCQGAAVVSPAGLDPVLTLHLATTERESGDRRALDRLDWLLSVATPTWTWPRAVHPRLATGSAGDGHSGPVAAELLSFVRNLLVRETADGGLALCSLVPETWLGQQLEVHDAPTHHGTLSFALRWHGDRPALLWELEPHDGARAVPITVPGLDGSWSTTELRGDALLAPVPPPVPDEPELEAPVASAETATPVRLTLRRPRDEG